MFIWGCRRVWWYLDSVNILMRGQYIVECHAWSWQFACFSVHKVMNIGGIMHNCGGRKFKEFGEFKIVSTTHHWFDDSAFQSMFSTYSSFAGLESIFTYFTPCQSNTTFKSGEKYHMPIANSSWVNIWHCMLKIHGLILQRENLMNHVLTTNKYLYSNRNTFT